MNDSQKFTATSFTRSKETREKWVRYLMFVVTLLMALPVILLISYLVQSGA